ncbi:tRNA (adenosine(37)-N6)-dimethylallyltransferase MiaA [Methylobacillus arboreus]|uniref:tRNA (adenosine(37)-N6)-dimethylallyltransferase MiaA n=1 Tax=Methylobacillus arboreus TaxID=755170 RepID=UPI001E60E5BD|nr:tRNA (adenosine(37)-N6)-dimethylallyltransferase MiaA [Methylobacillus arboreus]MCB5189839.1 tRNA (adenosine(37)-N6)-dimethylallyltransferase MiaA [Methylobacillus arboreus]
MTASVPPAIFLMGPTASGKTGLAVELVQTMPVEIISVDSALVYKDMDIGTAKPGPDILQQAPHHLVDIINPTEVYSAAQFRTDALRLMQEITSRGKVPLLVGGTMLYFKSLQQGLAGLPQADAATRAELDREAEKVGWPAMHARLAAIDPDTAARLQPTDSQRIQRALEVYALSGETMTALFRKQSLQALPYRLFKIALQPSDRAVLHARIAERFHAMISEGLLGEVQGLLEKYPTLHPDMTSMRCVGYRQTLDYIAGKIDHDAWREQGIAATRQLAKRQLTWLRGMDDTLVLDCLSPDLYGQTHREINEFLADTVSPSNL